MIAKTGNRKILQTLNKPEKATPTNVLLGITRAIKNSFTYSKTQKAQQVPSQLKRKKCLNTQANNQRKIEIMR